MVYSCLQGDRRAGTAGPSLSEFNFESQWGQKALKHMYRAICEVPNLSQYCPTMLGVSTSAALPCCPTLYTQYASTN